ncbi:hypothetical protein MJA45_21865 [Paenibacillus aurantius]|uniref:Uncharacterized protein n=1 Tax=Paenibacillus aurantius TaxID=2918900 RepID=A0AA96LBL8_9BACL|nr:hypothetical protein [Paenibacillus aurantius]WNQ10245.1 hypothetical protein MJA45_21865 [Paenibacillus aurantius]
MESEEKQVCPWCHTEIVWDPELGPEEECPHCFNELGAYRSVTFGAPAEEEDEEELDAAPVGELDDLDELEEEYRDEYSEKVEQVIDGQEEAPECTNCRELMLLAGQRTTGKEAWSPLVPEAVGKPLLAALEENVYVCPSCFKTESYLTEKARLALLKAVKD